MELLNQTIIIIILILTVTTNDSSITINSIVFIVIDNSPWTTCEILKHYFGAEKYVIRKIVHRTKVMNIHDLFQTPDFTLPPYKKKKNMSTDFL